MADKESQIIVSFAEGVTEGVAEEVAEGVVLRSQNTRLTKLKGTVSRRPRDVAIKTMFAAPTCGGMTVGVRDSVIAYFKPGKGQQRIIGSSTEQVIAPALGTPGQNAYYPYPVVDAGTLGGAYLSRPPATCFDENGDQWFAAGVKTATGGAIFASVLGDNGGQIGDWVTPRVILSQSLEPRFVALTPCTGGVVLWYQAPGFNIEARKLTRSGTVVTVGPATAVYQTTRNYEADVTSDGANAGYLLCRHATVDTTAVAMKVDLTTFAVTSSAQFTTVLTAATQTPFYCITRYVTGSGVETIAVAISDFSGNCYRTVLDATLAALWSNSQATGWGLVSALPFELFGRQSVIFAVAVRGALAPDIGGYTRTVFQERTRTAGTVLSTVTVSWYLLQSKGVAHSPAPGETYPYFPLVPRWQAAVFPPLPSDRTYMDTPQIVVVTPYVPNGFDPIGQFSPVMRCAVDRLAQMEGMGTWPGGPACALGADGRFCISYLEDRFDIPTSAPDGWSPRFVNFDLAFNGQPATAANVGPVGVVAASLPVTWDGRDTSEYCFFTRPYIIVDTATGGLGPSLSGTYSYTAVVSWRGAGGNVRRSMPARSVTVTMASKKPIISVSIPLTMLEGGRQVEFDITLYATVSGGAIFYAVNAENLTKFNGFWKWTYIFDTLATSLQLYSLGGPGETLLPECPPPAYDVRSIGGRLWLLDAEDRYRLLPSMLKTEGIVLEFSASFEVRGFDVQYGKLVAVVDVGGNPYVLSERGIWRVDGYGPDNAGMGGAFTDPQLVFNVGCRSRASVAQVPGVGVLFQCNDGRFALLTGGLERFETFGVYDVAQPFVHLLQNEVIYPLTDGSGYIVFNWVAKGWTKWPTATRRITASVSVPSAQHSRVYTYGSDGVINIQDSDTVDTVNTRTVLVERGWVAPAGPQGDCVIREFWVHVIYNAAHSVRVRASFDYDTASFMEATWTNLELVPLLQDGRYTVGLNCAAMPSRAIRVEVEITPDVAGETGQPLTLTVPYAASMGIRRRTLPDGAIK